MHIKAFLEKLGFCHLLGFSMSRTMNAIKSKLSSRYMASFKSKINEETTTKLITYTQFKTSFKKEHYLSHPVDKRIVFEFSRRSTVQSQVRN